ncbi:MAG TPA: hypothetical protein VGR91_19160 [Stellaceae bacterium]|nr:hypothetical protein [Stellaceae bacterium]
MRIRERAPGLDGSCVHCGASPVQLAAGGHSCLWRDRAESGEERASRRRIMAADDFDAIGARLREMQAEAADLAWRCATCQGGTGGCNGACSGCS